MEYRYYFILVNDENFEYRKILIQPNNVDYAEF